MEVTEEKESTMCLKWRMSNQTSNLKYIDHTDDNCLLAERIALQRKPWSGTLLLLEASEEGDNGKHGGRPLRGKPNF